ncbi:MAG: DUF3124 domain-containing protein [Polyangiales bacterium]
MGDDSKYPEWFLWLSEHGIRILILVSLGGLAFVYARGRSDTDARLDAIEETVQSDPPRAYHPPDPANYPANGVSVASLATSDVVYVPVYSHIYYDGGRPYLLEATLSIRNTDTKNPIYVTGVDYYDTDGRRSKKFVSEIIGLKPLQTVEFLVERKDPTGGSGANFIVTWGATAADVDVPFIEAVMVGRSGTNAISFVSQGRAIESGRD